MSAVRLVLIEGIPGQTRVGFPCLRVDETGDWPSRERRIAGRLETDLKSSFQMID